MTPVQEAGLEELEKLLALKRRAIFAKESRLSSSKSRRLMKANLMSYSSSAAWAGPLQDQDQAADVPSYLRQKAREGKANVRGQK